MKKFLLVFVFICSLCVSYAQSVKIDECKITCDYGFMKETFSAYGNVYIETNPKEPVELEVRIVTNPAIADFSVFKTTDTPKQCGEWRFVKDRSKADFSIRYVKEHEDCTIHFTSNRNDAGWNIVLRH
ncbi:MAG: hypothetical protein IKN61_04110 [Bacteroidaceae bacterium]|nr:hypothetical protein [Bacteroidaceae bacterium]MBR4535944.1 hypothetical protein [Bacteroidales bacterium]